MNDENKTRLLNIGTAAEYLGISIDTLRRWEKKGRINPLRSPGGHRYYSKDELDSLFGKRYSREEETIRRTNEELGKFDASPQSPLSSDASAKKDLSSEAPQNESASAIPQLSNPVSIPSWRPVSEENMSQVAPPLKDLSETHIPSSPNEVLPTDKEKITEEVVGARKENSSSESETVSSHNKTVSETPKEETDNTETSTDKTTPATNLGDYSSIPNILLPRRDEKEDNILSQEEIEKRINTIINKKEKKSYSNILLAIASFIMLAADIFLLYMWFVSSRTASPIP